MPESCRSVSSSADGADLDVLVERARREHPDVPLFLLGHSVRYVFTANRRTYGMSVENRFV